MYKFNKLQDTKVYLSHFKITRDSILYKEN